MKKIILTLTCMSIICHAFTQSVKPRTEKEMQKMISKYGSKYYMDFSQIDEKHLNTIESTLLQHFDYVFVSKSMTNCYIVSDFDLSNSNVSCGLYSLQGEEIAPLTNGLIIPMFGNYIIGMDSKDLLAGTNRMYSGIGIGHFVAVINAKTLEPVIPRGKYDDIQYTIKGNSIYYYVAKLDDDGQLRWGVCDSTGKEVLPVEYLSIRKEGSAMGIKSNGMIVYGKFIGSNSLTMDDAEILTENNIALVLERKRHWASALNAVGQTMTVTAQAMQAVGVGSNSSDDFGVSASDGGSAASGNYRQQYAHWERLAHNHFESLTNLGARAETESSASGVSGGLGHLSSSNYIQMKKALRDAQEQMAEIRRKASRAGVDIPQSKWETAVVAY